METEMLDRDSAERYASWFKALADPTRVQLVTLLAKQGRPMTVGEIVSVSGVGQSTVSHHLKALAEVRFVLSEQRGTSRWYRINGACVSCFPCAADIVMGRDVPEPPGCDASSVGSARAAGGLVATRRRHLDRPRATRTTADRKQTRS
jgi:DNA-binding transcriptional ArsR family regulator